MLSPKKIEKSTIQSLKNLKIEQIDLLQIHWPNPDINVYHSIDKLIELKERKIIKAIGLCNYNFFEMNDMDSNNPVKILDIQSFLSLYSP
jgi:diketogulonate reductase-like aldo/keto reductase